MLLVCSTCGLAEELEKESKAAQKASQPKSACGSVRIFIIKSICTNDDFEMLYTL